MVSTDPPYYDNIGYADLSDFFYVWMRQSLKETYPKLFRTMLVPKAEELIATPYRHQGNMQEAKVFFEDGMLHTCQQIYQYACEDVPVTIYYAYKQSDTDEKDAEKQTASTGWETMLSAIVKAGFSITGTWPMRTELTTALKGSVNALASSIVLVCRKRPADAPQATRRSLIAELKRELRPALKKLQESNIAPVDLAQSAIGPGHGRVLPLCPRAGSRRHPHDRAQCAADHQSGAGCVLQRAGRRAGCQQPLLRRPVHPERL